MSAPSTPASAEDIRAIRRLIRRYTIKRDWEVVRALFFDLGQILQAREKENDG